MPQRFCLLLFLFGFLLPAHARQRAPAPAQSILHIPLSRCVWHAGDNPAWAAPSLNETGWLPLAAMGLGTTIPPPHVWIRCHADLTPLRSLAHPALQAAYVDGAYQAFLNGKKIGGAGNMRTGAVSMDRIRQYPVPVSLIGKPPDTVALRMTVNYVDFNFGAPAQFFSAGGSEALRGRRARRVLGGPSHYWSRRSASSRSVS